MHGQIRVKTLASILKSVAQHHDMAVGELIDVLGL